MPDITDSEMETLLKHGAAKPVSMSESIARGAGQGLTLGFQPEISAGLEHGMIAAHNLVSNNQIEQPTNATQEFHAQNENAKASNPKAYKAAKLGGGFLSMIPAGEGILANTAIGALQGAGENPDNRLAGGLMGGIMGGSVAAATKMINPEALAKGAVDLSRRALGFLKGDIKKVGLDTANATAKDLLERGVIHADFKDTAAAVEALREDSGTMIGNILDALDKSGNPAQINKDQLIEDFTNKKIDQNGLTIGEMMKLDVFKPIRNEYENLVSTMKDSKFAADTFQAAQQLKQVIKQAGWGIGGKTQGSDVAKQAYFAVRDGIDNAIENASAKLDNPELSQQFLDAKKAYSSAKTAEKAIDNKLSSLAGNRLISLTDFVFTPSNMLNVKGMAALAGKKFIEQKGAGFGANALNAASKVAGYKGILNQILPVARPAIITGINQKVGSK